MGDASRRKELVMSADDGWRKTRLHHHLAPPIVIT
jgi:hypothetical protein